MTASYLGTGWSFPPRFAGQGATVATVGGAAAVAQSIRVLVATEARERVMRPQVGAGLERALFEEVDQTTLNRVSSWVQDTLLAHEPRAVLEDVVVDAGQEPGELRVSVRYSLPHGNSRFNLVYPFSVLEAEGAAQR